jgi:cytochrome b561
MQAFRLLRIFRLLTAWRKPREQLVGVAKALMHTRPLLAIMALYLVVVALLGMGIFGRTMSIRDNFDDFGSAFITAFQLLTVDQWQFV